MGYVNSSAMTMADLENIDQIQQSGQQLVMEPKQQARTEQRKSKDLSNMQIGNVESSMASSI